MNIGVKTATLLLTAGLVVIGFHRPATAVQFGKNKVQYTRFRWQYLSTEHFNIYYSEGGRAVADFTAEVAEEVFDEISGKFNYTAGTEPITVITYKSHNDFQQNNVSSGEPDESTGGFTEFLKTRVVVPFEGNYENFRHVIHHEITHAMFLNLLYGKGLGAIISGISQARVPLWFIEGLPEYQSRHGLDPETEMILRDAVVNDFLPEISQLDQYGYVGVYKGGQSVLYYIAWRYGDEKIGELLQKMKGMLDFDRALRAAIGIDQKELSKRWRRFIQERYWPQVAKMDPPEEFARRLTDHKKEYCFVNNSPALSPDGEWLAFLSDRSDYFDVYLMSVIDGKVVKRLVRGQRTGKFEELHWLRPGITWSPDSKSIAFCAKAGDQDALYLIDTQSGDIVRQVKLGADALYSPSWSPDGSRIALVQVVNGSSDILVYDITSGDVRNVTDDIWDDADPSWSSDGKRLLFTSNRGGATVKSALPADETIYDHPFADFDIYDLDLRDGRLTRLTSDRFMERTPLWAEDDSTLLYVSDHSGAYNIYLQGPAGDEPRAITNIVTGAFQPSLSRSSGMLVFTSYYDYGYDVYTISDPLNRSRKAEPLALPAAETISGEYNLAEGAGMESGTYSHFVFDRLLKPREVEPAAGEAVEDTAAAARARNEMGRYPSHEYKVKLTPDMVFLYASYSPYYLMQGSGILLLTDEMGDHQVYMSLDLNRSLEYSNLFFMYQYLAGRIDYGVGAYHYPFLFYSSGVDWLDRNWGLFVTGSYPLDRYNRAEFSLEQSVVDRSVFRNYLEQDVGGQRLSTLTPRVGYIHDTSVWGYSTSPSNGGRWRVDGAFDPDLKGETAKGYDFATVSFDWRRYFAFRKDFTFAFRASGAVSQGANPQRFFLGGVLNWFNNRFDNPEGGVLLDIHDIYFSTFATPLRGVGYYNQMGTRYLLGNFEFRFPFIRHLLLGWPLPLQIRNLRGAAFLDYGSAWNPENLNRRLFPRIWTHGYGFALRVNLGLFPLEWDLAWSPMSDFKPQYYLSLNLGF